MRFHIHRTSTGYDTQPCEEAVPGTYIERDYRAFDDPTKIPAYRHDPECAKREWYGEGTNHRIEHGWIVRDMGESQGWFIDIESVEQLIVLQQKYGDVILTSRIFTDEPAIEIYDNYRE